VRWIGLPHCRRPAAKAAVSRSNPPCQNPSAAAFAEIPGLCRSDQPGVALAVAAPVVGKADLLCREGALAVAGIPPVFEWAALVFGPPPGYGGKNHPAVECSGYTYMSPALITGYAPLPQGGGGDLCHFGRSHGPLQSVDPILAQISAQRPQQ